ncbi:arginine deiminase family protein [Chryseolinea sp. T2]|uniref:dimethylarginine dimethylaminohydrolase family protein n=1 Tax=Chryseolinea sp. T2 TaxID=3129255 RepID=UPI0030779323
MKLTCHSEYGDLRSVYLKHPREAMVDDQRIANTWQALNFLSRPDLSRAFSEYAVFESLLKITAPEVHHLPFHSDVTMDSMYCRDASLATDFGLILCNMGKHLRKPEPTACREAFQASGMRILGAIESPGTLEGGDVAWLDTKTLAVGHTYRTNAAGIEQLKALVEPHGIEVIVAQLPHYKGKSDVFHLMSILSPIDQDLAVVYSPLMPIPFREYLLSRGFGLIESPDNEFDSMGCNVLAIGPRQVIVVGGNPVTRSHLNSAGCTVYEYEGANISVAGGGGPTCLTRPVLRALR